MNTVFIKSFSLGKAVNKLNETPIESINQLHKLLTEYKKDAIILNLFDSHKPLVLSVATVNKNNENILKTYGITKNYRL